MMTGLPLPHRSVGQVTLEGETERWVFFCRNHSHCSVDPKTSQRACYFLSSVFFFFFFMPKWGATCGGDGLDGMGIGRCRGGAGSKCHKVSFWFLKLPCYAKITSPMPLASEWTPQKQEKSVVYWFCLFQRVSESVRTQSWKPGPL